MIFRPCYFYFFFCTLQVGWVGFEKYGKFRTFFFLKPSLMDIFLGHPVYKKHVCRRHYLLLNQQIWHPRALATKFEFYQQPAFFQHLWVKGSPETLTVKSNIYGFWRNCYTGCPKIRSVEDINYFIIVYIHFILIFILLMFSLTI